MATVGIAAINNVVDITNYVLLECGQPLHAFDLAKLRGRKIIVREAQAGEALEAINHKSYVLEPGMCVIADAERPVAMAGVMGGADTEVIDGTTDLLIEVGAFDPLSIRTTARKLNLHSDSSYRFERGVDVRRRRLGQPPLLRTDSGTGRRRVGRRRDRRRLRVSRRASRSRCASRSSSASSGIDVPMAEADGFFRRRSSRRSASTPAPIPQGARRRSHRSAPSWRRDLTREIDLIEEVARIHGYDKIPEDVSVPMAPRSAPMTIAYSPKCRTCSPRAGSTKR